MSEKIVIRQGLDIRLFGQPESTITSIGAGTFAIKPTDFIGVFPKLLVKEGDKVKAGTPLFFDKARNEILFTAPASGTIKDIRRGAKRILLEVIIEADDKMVYEDFGKADPSVLDREKVVELLLKSGTWPLIRQRPYTVIANPADHPKSIFISCFDTHPLAPDYNLVVVDKQREFQAGIDALTKLTTGKIHLNLPAGKESSKVFTNSRNVNINYISGPHPAGNVGTQINRIDPINKGEIVWFLRPDAVITIGRLFLEGHYNAEKLVAITGSEVLKPGYIRTLTGACIHNLLKNNTTNKKNRYISGNVLTGTKIDRDGYIGFYDSQLTVIPEGDYYEFFGWALPGLGKFSFSRSFFTWLHPKKRTYKLDTNLHGSERALVMTGQMEKVFPFDIYPMQLIKAIITEDIDAMENLGIYEVDEEDFALCEFIDTSKTEIQSIVRKGLDLMRKEMS